MENGRWAVFNFLTLIMCLRWKGSGGFMGDLVFNGGSELFHNHILSKLSFIHFHRKIRYLGWKPTVRDFH